MNGLVELSCMAAIIVGAEELPAPPVAPVRVVTDDHHGTKIDDPYRYFENQTHPDVARWIKGQADYAAAVLAAIPERDVMLARLRQIDQGGASRISDLQPRPNGDVYYFKQRPDDALPKFYHWDAVKDSLLIDPARHDGRNKQRASLTYCVPSPDGKHVAYGVAQGGSEETTIYVLDVADGKDLPEAIDRIETAYTEPQWLPDGSGFYYVRRRKLTPDAPVPSPGRRSRPGSADSGHGRLAGHSAGGDGFSQPRSHARLAVCDCEDQARRRERCDALRGPRGRSGDAAHQVEANL
jgi:prolyl oligopeptidase